MVNVRVCDCPLASEKEEGDTVVLNPDVTAVAVTCQLPDRVAVTVRVQLHEVTQFSSTTAGTLRERGSPPSCGLAAE